MAVKVALFRVYTVKGDDVRRVGNYTYDEGVARSLAKNQKSGAGSRGRKVMLVPTTDKGTERWKDAVEA